MLTLKQARKKLGKKADDLSDEELTKEIEFANFLAELVLEQYLNKTNIKGAVGVK